MLTTSFYVRRVPIQPLLTFLYTLHQLVLVKHQAYKHYPLIDPTLWQLFPQPVDTLLRYHYQCHGRGSSTKARGEPAMMDAGLRGAG